MSLTCELPGSLRLSSSGTGSDSAGRFSCIFTSALLSVSGFATTGRGWSGAMRQFFFGCVDIWQVGQRESHERKTCFM